jgi:hypothetical protein
VNIVAELTLEALRVHGVAGWFHYRDALITACRKAPPPFGTKAYGKIYRDVAKDPSWMAVSLIQNAQGEGEGSQHLWDLAASTPDVRVAAQVKQHAIDESRHAKAYAAMLDLAFPRSPMMTSRHNLLRCHLGTPNEAVSRPLKARRMRAR